MLDLHPPHERFVISVVSMAPDRERCPDGHVLSICVEFPYAIAPDGKTRGFTYRAYSRVEKAGSKAVGELVGHFFQLALDAMGHERGEYQEG